MNKKHLIIAGLAIAALWYFERQQAQARTAAAINPNNFAINPSPQYGFGLAGNGSSNWT